MTSEDEGRDEGTGTGSGPASGPGPGSGSGHHHDVGSLGEEAVRLLGALSGWATQHGAEAQRGAEEVVRQAAEGVRAAAHGFEEHLATGAAECTWCPVCRTVHAVRTLSPEVTVHLGAAATSLVRAAAALMATTVPDSAAEKRPTAADGAADPQPSGDRVQRIPLDDRPTP
ncbi:hypothetical protein [Nocardioides jishulii]|uniref:Uncharacterized protein n=1 Tax=Nocardioides jishulii TaxID=2575440 RepID=A0A4U2YM49_9ACTN|nr:hypothetical protein [Nocardioides jishulii]QCX27148.1 hypothetical protein FCL41_06090 [Nocardioides jishulii]TKI61632.1 hypothetical protein FC770_12725 [Nocardioides jishulii]